MRDRELVRDGDGDDAELVPLQLLSPSPSDPTGVPGGMSISAHAPPHSSHLGAHTGATSTDATMVTGVAAGPNAERGCCCRRRDRRRSSGSPTAPGC